MTSLTDLAGRDKVPRRPRASFSSSSTLAAAPPPLPPPFYLLHHKMLLYTDIFTGDEMVSDAYDVSGLRNELGGRLLAVHDSTFAEGILGPRELDGVAPTTFRTHCIPSTELHQLSLPHNSSAGTFLSSGSRR